MHISQPALTRRIQELESEYGAELFEGAGKGMTPTEAGLLLQVRARQIVNLDNAVRHELESAGEGLAGMVRIGCVETNGAHALARWQRSWRCLHPRTRVEIDSADSDDLKAHLDAGAIDAALLLGPVEATKYQNVPLPRETAVTTDMLEGFPLMLPHRHILRDAFEEWFGESASRMTVAGFINLSTVPFMTLAGDARTVMLVVKGAFDMRPPAGLVFIPLVPERTSEQILVRRRNVALSSAAEAFWAHAARSAERDDAGE